MNKFPVADIPEVPDQVNHANPECLPVGVIILDVCGKIVSCNEVARTLFGQDLAEMAWHTLVTSVLEPLGYPESGYALRDGRCFLITARSTEHGEVIALTPLPGDRQSLARDSRLHWLGMQLGTLAHQLQSPMTAALLSAAPLASANQDPAARERAFRRLETSLENMRRLTEDILAFTRDVTVRKLPVSVIALCDVLQLQAEPLVQRHGAILQVMAPARDVVVSLAETAITGAVLNLVTNALQAGADRVEINAEPVGKGVRICVRDNGRGMDEATRNRVFEPFFTTRPDGNGLGLHVVREVVQSHGGFCKATANPAGGTCVCLEIP